MKKIVSKYWALKRARLINKMIDEVQKSVLKPEIKKQFVKIMESEK